MKKETQISGEAHRLDKKEGGKPLKLEDFLGRTLTEEEAKKVDSIEIDQRTYASTLGLEEMKMYKLELLEEIREVEGDYGPSHVVEVLCHNDGEKYSVWLPTVLRRKLRDCKAGKGVTVGVIYKGKPEGKRYKDFAVFVWTDEALKLRDHAEKDKT